MNFKRCIKCVMPNTRPGITFNADGVCSACQSHENRKNVDWKGRELEFFYMLERHRTTLDKWDCIIAVSGGKDSTYQVKVLKEDYGMNPLLVNVSNFVWTETGKANYANMLETFDCECISLDLSPATCKKMFRYSFETYGSPTWYFDRAVYTYPLYVAKQFGIPLVVYGENIGYEYGGADAHDTPDARGQINNAVANGYGLHDYAGAGIDLKRAYLMRAPDMDDIEPIYLSYYFPWSGTRNLLTAKGYGFKELTKWEEREGFIEQYDQIDSAGYLVHCWMKWPKFGHARATDVASSWIREDLINRDRAMDLVKKHDHVLDENIAEEFRAFCGYSEHEFLDIVDKWYNRDIFTQDDCGNWHLKE